MVRGGLGPRGGAWVRAAAAHHVHTAEVLDHDPCAAIPAGTPALLSRDEADDVLEVLDTVAAAMHPGPGRDRVEDLSRVLRERLRHT